MDMRLSILGVVTVICLAQSFVSAEFTCFAGTKKKEGICAPRRCHSFKEGDDIPWGKAPYITDYNGFEYRYSCQGLGQEAGFCCKSVNGAPEGDTTKGTNCANVESNVGC